MQFMSKQEALPYRVEHAFKRGMAYFERGDLQRAWLAGNVASRFAPDRVEGHLLLARVSRRKGAVLGEPLFNLDAKAAYEAVLKVDPANAEAKQGLVEIGELGLGEKDLLAWRDRCLGTEPVAFKICQLGYHPEGCKSAVIWTLEDFPSGTFRLVDRITGKTELQGRLDRRGCYAWKRYHWVADFSAAEREGEFELEVTFVNSPNPPPHPPRGCGAASPSRGEAIALAVTEPGPSPLGGEGRGEGDNGGLVRAVSHPFTISAGVYERTMRLSMEGFFHHRCGQDLPWRPGCNEGPVRFKDRNNNWLKEEEDDLVELDKPVGIRHGWHDGGNWERVSSNMVTNLYCLLLAHEYAPRDWHQYGEAAPDTLVEARYGVDFFLSCLDAVGTAQVITHLRGVAQAPDGRHFMTNLYLSYEDQPKLHFVTVFPQHRGTWVPWYPRLYAASLAFFALQYSRYDAVLADRCRDAAVRLQTFHREPDANETLTSFTVGSIAMGDMYLWQLTGESRYKEQAREGIRQVLSRADAEGFFPAEGAEQRAIYLGGPFHLISLFEFARVFRDDPLRAEVVRALERFMPWIEKLCSMSPFGHMMEYKTSDPLNFGQVINGHGTNAYFGYIAILCLLANRLFGTRRYTAIAERQTQWLLGRNTAGVCFLGCAGWRNSSQHVMDVCDHGREFKAVPGLGRDYPFFATHDVDGAGQGLSIHWSTCEGGGMTEGPLQAALALLAAELPGG